VSLTSSDQLTKHAPSFFSYRGFDRLYKFFESRDYFDLEKHFSVMLSLDVSKCFDSIYTHTLSWAVKDKEFTKQHMPVSGTFADEFDALMMHANHSETNGIVIGPEVSRVFAEIIFQEVDLKAINQVRERCEWEFDKEYTFRRYVDDVFIFAESVEMAESVYSIYADVLLEFNLHANSGKRQVMMRPFVTDKSRIILEASNEVNNFVDKFLEPIDGSKYLRPKQIRSVFRLTRSFIESLKVLCSYNQVNYDDISAYLIAVLTERIKRLVAVESDITGESEAKNYSDSLVVLLDVLYFLYEVSPSVPASYKFCASIILVTQFAETRLKLHFSTIAQRIYELTETLLTGQKLRSNSSVQGFFPLEVLNVVLAARGLGSEYLLPEATVKSLFCSGPRLSYFSIVSSLFYMQNETRYNNLRVEIVDGAASLLGDLKDVRINSEKAYLLLDLLSCPFIPCKNKRVWLRSACSALGLPSPTNAEADEYLQAALQVHAHINWNEVNLLNTLEKKELKRAY
jgi:hypothetical protein